MRNMHVITAERNNYIMKKSIFMFFTFMLMTYHFSFAMDGDFEYCLQTAKDALENCQKGEVKEAELKIKKILSGSDLLSEDQNAQIDEIAENFLDSKIEEMAISLLHFVQEKNRLPQEDSEMLPIDNDVKGSIIVTARDQLRNGKNEEEVLEEIKRRLKDHMLWVDDEG